MLDNEFFSVRRLSSTSQAKLREISEYLKPHFAVTQWDHEIDCLLQERVQHKIKRIRADLVGQRKLRFHGDRYTVLNPSGVDSDTDTAGGDSTEIETLVAGTLALSYAGRHAFLHRVIQDLDIGRLSQVADALSQRLHGLSRPISHAAGQ